MNTTDLRRRFREKFSADPRVFRAPGRVNLIGEHTDYNDGFVMPAAIGFATWAAAAARPDPRVHVFSSNLNEPFEFDLDDDTPRQRWSDYVQGIAVTLQKNGLALSGANILIDSEVPLGSGLSSSAALLVSTARALLACAGAVCDPHRLARICLQAESEFVGIHCGIMDQFTSIFGRQDHAILLDCRSLDFDYLPLPAGASLVVCNTMVKHEHAGGEYNRRRADCEEASKRMGVTHLRDAGASALEVLPEAIRKRARHIISENERVGLAATALRSGDLAAFGLLMDASHESLRVDYEVSCDELDLMVRLAHECEGVYGARMTGGGFGGCALALVDDPAVSAFTTRVREGYRQSTGVNPDIYVCRAAAGASEVLD